MPRMGRLHLKGGCYHVMGRGLERRAIFLKDSDKADFLERLADGLAGGYACLAWSLMPNHYHLLLRVQDAPLSVLMRRLLSGYANVDTAGPGLRSRPIAARSIAANTSSNFGTSSVNSLTGQCPHLPLRLVWAEHFKDVPLRRRLVIESAEIDPTAFDRLKIDGIDDHLGRAGIEMLLNTISDLRFRAPRDQGID